MLNFPNFDITFDEELAWLCNVQQSFSTYAEDTEYPGWARYQSHYNRGPKQPPGNNTTLPLIPEKVNTLQTQCHCMTFNINLTRVLNPIQTPVDVSEKPVYALTKELQYRYPHLFEKYYPIMGGLHIEQSLLRIYGQLYEVSFIAEIITLHSFLTVGLSVITGTSHLKRARYAIQVTVCALFLKLQEASVKDGSNLHPYSYGWLKSL